MSVSTDEGEIWSEARSIHGKCAGTPKVMGTLTRLWTAKLVAPLVEADVVRLFASEDNG